MKYGLFSSSLFIAYVLIGWVKYLPKQPITVYGQRHHTLILYKYNKIKQLIICSKFFREREKKT